MAGASTAAFSLLSATSNVIVGTATAPSNNQVLTATGAGAASWQAVPAATMQGAKVFLSADQSIGTNTNVKVTFNTVEYDNGTNFGTSNSRYTVPTGQGGLYMVHSNGYLYGNMVSGAVYYWLHFVNGTQRAVGQTYTAAAAGQDAALTSAFNLVATDYIEFYFFQNVGTGNSLYANGGTSTHTYAFVQKVSP